MNNPLKRFGVRVTTAIILSILTVVVLSGVLIYQFSFQSQFEAIRNRLKVIAQTAVLMIDAQKVAQIPLSQDGFQTPFYASVTDQLRKIKAVNPQIRFIYILTRVDSSGTWRFVADPDADNKKGKMDYPGAPYNAARFQELVKAFDQPGADRKIEFDEWGPSVSGYAPIRDSIGRPIAVLGVDISAEDIYAMQHEVFRRIFLILALGFLLALLVGSLISRRITTPVHDLITGTRYIAQGNLHHQVKVTGDDEISELANSFNSMSLSLSESRQKLLNYFYDTVNSLVMLLEVRDHYTLGHSESVANYSEKIARRMGVDEKTLEIFKRAALLHDIGKVGVRDSVLLKAGKLTAEEWEAIKMHPVLGEQILKPIIDDPRMLAIIRNHHERYDGQGYPDGLSRDQIPILVAIVSVADAYDAMTSSRAYRKALSKEEAIEQLVQNRGKQFHPDVVDVFLEILNEDAK